MLKYFYLVEFSYIARDGEQSRFDLGVFSTTANAQKKIEMAKNLAGFKDYPTRNFLIKKFGVSFSEKCIDKSNVKLYCVYHEYTDPQNVEESFYCIFDYFSTQNQAEAKMCYLQKHSRIGKKYPNNFEISRVSVDNYNSWSEGFEILE